MKFVVNVIGIAVFLVWLYFCLRYPPRWLARWYDVARIELPAALRRFVSAAGTIPSTIARAGVRGTVRMFHAFVTDNDDPLRLLPSHHELLPAYLYRLPTLAARNRRATALYWNIVHDERREEEVLWVGGPTAFHAEDWSIKIVWWRGASDNDWPVKEWRVNGVKQNTLMPNDWFTEKCMLSNMLCAVKTAKATSLLVERSTPETKEGT